MNVAELIPEKEYKVVNVFERTAKFNGVRWYGGRFILDMEYTDTKEYIPFSIHQWEIEQKEFVISTIN